MRQYDIYKNQLCFMVRVREIFCYLLFNNQDLEHSLQLVCVLEAAGLLQLADHRRLGVITRRITLNKIYAALIT